MPSFIQGLLYFFKGIEVIHSNNLWKFIVIPSLINLSLGVIMICFSIFYLTDLVLDKILQLYQYWINPDVLSSTALLLLLKLFSFIISSLLSIGLYIVFYTSLFSILLMPYLSGLLNEMEQMYLGKTKPSKSTLLSTYTIVVGSIKRTTIILVSFFASIAFGPFQPFVLGFLQGYYLGKDSFYCLIEKDAKSIKHQELLLKRYRGESMGLGFANFMLLFIPVVGLVLSPAASLCGAFLIYYKKE